MWKKTLVGPETTIKDTISVIDKASLQIALVVNKKEQLLGTVTDGDIRRGILNYIHLAEPVSKIMNTHPRYIFEHSRETALLLMKNHRLRQIPIVDEDLRLVGLEIAEDLLIPSPRNNIVVLMAGGLGKRLKPLTESCPKPLLTVGGKPLLRTILETLIEQGFRCFYLTVNYKAEMIMDYLRDGSQWGVEIRYLQEKKIMGTAGSLGLLPRQLTEPLLIMNGDILTKINIGKLLEFHKQSNSIATICIKEHKNQIPYGIVTFDNNRLQHIDEKPVQQFFINAGIYVINPEVLDYIPPNTFFDFTDLIKTLLQNGKKVSVFPISEYWIDIGRFDEYEKANQEFTEVFE